MIFFEALFWGILTGILSGLFGIGGSIISTPALRLGMKTSAAIALGTTLPVIVPTAIVAGYNFYRAKLVDKKLVLYVAPMGILGSIIGSYVTAYIDPRYLMIVTAILVIYFGIEFIKKRKIKVLPEFSAVRTILLGFVAGFVSGLLGVGGGIVLIPGFHFLCGVPIKIAMGTSLVIITLLAIPGSVVHYFLRHIDLIIFMGLTLGVIPGSQIGSRITVKVKDDRIKKAFGIFLIIIGVVFIISEMLDLKIVGK